MNAPGGGGSVDLGPVLAALAANTQALAEIRQLLAEAHLSDINPAIDAVKTALTGLVGRLDTDYNHLLDIIRQMSETAANDQARIAELMAEAEGVVGKLDEIKASVDAIDLDPAFPPVEPGDGGNGEPGDGEPNPDVPVDDNGQPVVPVDAEGNPR